MVDSFRYGYNSDYSSEPKIRGIITFLRSYSELCQKAKTLTVFRLSCFCKTQFHPSLPDLQLGSAVSTSDGPRLSKMIESLKNSLLSCQPKKFHLELVSIGGCFILSDTFHGFALQSD